MANELTGKIVVVTGGTAGVGYAADAAFARAGALTVVISRDDDRVKGAVAALEAAGGRAHGMTLDVSDSAAVDRAADEIESQLGPIEVWVNNAMTTVYGTFADMTTAEFDKVTANTYLGTVYGTHAALRVMLPRNRGTIVQVGSALAFQSIPLQSAYCGAKYAIRGFTNAVRCELMKHRSKVRMSQVHLSAFNTPQFDWARSHLDSNPRPLAPVFSPDLAARAVLRAALHPRREYWVGWPAMKTIIGSRLVPAVADWLAVRQAYDGQMSDERSPPRPGNLFEPVPREAGAEGRFGSETRPSSMQWWLTSHRMTAGLVVTIAAAAIVLWVVVAELT